MPRCIHPPGSRQQTVYRSGVYLPRNEFLAYAVPDSGRKAAAPNGPQQNLRVEQGTALLLLISIPRYSDPRGIFSGQAGICDHCPMVPTGSGLAEIAPSSGQTPFPAAPESSIMYGRG